MTAAVVDFDFANPVPAMVVEPDMPMTVVTVAMVMAEQVVTVMMSAVVIKKQAEPVIRAMSAGSSPVIISVVTAGTLVIIESVMVTTAAMTGMAAAFFGHDLRGGTQYQGTTEGEQQQQSGHDNLRESALRGVCVTTCLKLTTNARRRAAVTRFCPEMALFRNPGVNPRF